MLEGGILDPIHKETVDKTYIALQMADFFFCFNSIMIYSTIKRVVTCIQYIPGTDKIILKQFSSMFLKEVELERDPKDIIKCKR